MINQGHITQHYNKIKAIAKYNNNPNHCKYCGKEILCNEDQELCYIKIKKFCNIQCASKYNHINHKCYKSSKINQKSNDELNEIFNKSNSRKEFALNLGYKSWNNLTKVKSTIDKLESAGITQNIIKQKFDYDLHSETKGDLFERYPNWQSARAQIQKNARKIYEESTKPKYCIVCGYDKHYEVAHIKAVSSFDDRVLIDEINTSNNLIALCPNHHWEYDNNELDILNYL